MGKDMPICEAAAKKKKDDFSSREPGVSPLKPEMMPFIYLFSIFISSSAYSARARMETSSFSSQQ
jgi:hypothetical protein